MDWKILWTMQVWSSSSWTSCLPLDVVNTRRRVRSSCSCSTSRPSPTRSCCRVPAQARWTSQCRKVSAPWTRPAGRGAQHPSPHRHLFPPSLQRETSIISYLHIHKILLVKCHRGLGGVTEILSAIGVFNFKKALHSKNNGLV